MDFQTEIFDLNDIRDKLRTELDRAGNDAYAENLAKSVQSVERTIGWLEEAERTQPRRLKVVQ